MDKYFSVIHISNEFTEREFMNLDTGQSVLLFLKKSIKHKL